MQTHISPHPTLADTVRVQYVQTHISPHPTLADTVGVHANAYFPHPTLAGFLPENCFGILFPAVARIGAVLHLSV